MSSCETSDATSNSSVGILLVLLACICYAVGNCLQRYSLLRQDHQKVLYVLNRHAGWLLGAIIYFSANGIYAIALSFAPVSVLAAVFSLTIVANAACANFVLGDKVSPWAYPGYAAVLAGSIVFSRTIQAEVCHFGPEELKDVLVSPTACVYWIVMGGIIFGGIYYAYKFEQRYPVDLEDQQDDAKKLDSTTTQDEEDTKVVVSQSGRNNNNASMMDDATDKATISSYMSSPISQRHNNAEDPLASPSSALTEPPVLENGSNDNDGALEKGPSPVSLLIAGFVYPASLGATEAVGALILKAVNSLLTTYATEEGEEGTQEEQEDVHLDLWIGLMGVGGFIFLGIVAWLRLVYSRFEITSAFPVEFGMLTFASVVGGFAVFEDHRYVDGGWAWVMVVLASLLILGGIAIVGIASWRDKVNRLVQ